jgi:hypothetical protein
MKSNILNNHRGIALVFTLFFVVIFFIFQGIMVLNVIHQTRMAAIEREQAQTFYVAQGGANAAIEELDVLINNYLQTTISNASPSGVINYAQSKVNSGDGVGWLVYAVRNNNNPVLSQNGEEASYSANSSLGGTNYTYSIVFTEKNDPAASGVDAWDFPYSYRIQSTATRGSINTKVAVSGDFTVRVQRDNFAKFSLFTNRQQMPNGTNVWFTDKTNFAGPVHTNDRFNFALNPSGTFEQTISQEEQTARFYNSGNSVLLNNDHNGNLDVPVFHDSFERDADQITLNSATEETDMVSQVKGNNNYANNGIYLPTQGSSLTGGIYVKGDSTVALSVNGQNKAVYTITQGSATRVITVDHVGEQTTVTDPSTGSSTTYTGKPDGADDVGTLIFVDGNITSLAGTVQPDTELTVASHSDIVITNNVRYTNYTAATGTPGQSGYVPPSADGYTNLLGLVSWGGDVRVGTAAPNNVQIHGTIMAENGIFAVDNYDDSGVGPRGTATLLGGAITDDYGAFGQFNGSTGAQTSGYGRNFIYDGRMQAGKAPPYFPSLDTFIAFTNDITDKLVWQEGG